MTFVYQTCPKKFHSLHVSGSSGPTYIQHPFGVVWFGLVLDTSEAKKLAEDQKRKSVAKKKEGRNGEQRREQDLDETQPEEGESHGSAFHQTRPRRIRL